MRDVGHQLLSVPCNRSQMMFSSLWPCWNSMHGLHALDHQGADGVVVFDEMRTHLVWTPLQQHLWRAGYGRAHPPFPRRAARTASPRQSPWPSPQPRAHPRGAWNAERDRHAETRLGNGERVCFGITRGGSRARDFLGSARVRRPTSKRSPTAPKSFYFRIPRHSLFLFWLPQSNIH